MIEGENSPESTIIQMKRKRVNLHDFAGNLDDLSGNNIEDRLKNATKGHENVDYLEKSSQSILRSISKYLYMTNPLDWLFILFFSVTTTVILFIFDLLLAWGLELRLTMCSTNSPFFNLILWVTTAIIFLLIATSVGYFICLDADGSGIPEVKTVISGINIYRYFSVEAFVAKVIGLYAALVGGKNNY
jgi:H+/Cl- antiporter ClcA